MKFLAIRIGKTDAKKEVDDLCDKTVMDREKIPAGTCFPVKIIKCEKQDICQD